MKNHFAGAAAAAIASLGLLLPFSAFASVTINSVSFVGAGSNGVIVVQPGDNITASITATLSDKSKWKGINWGIQNDSGTPICVNTKNAKDGTRNSSTGSFTETFTMKAPDVPGIYNANFTADLGNNCTLAETPAYVIQNTVLVGNATATPFIQPHGDVTYQLTSPGTSAAVTYTNPLASDQFGDPLAVTCSPASGSTFPVGSTLITCNATDAWGNAADPSFFHVTVVGITPTIAPHADVLATTNFPNGTNVSYDLPAVTNNYDGAPLSAACAPASGSLFPLGTTTVTCNATDGAGQMASSTSFNVVVSLAGHQPVVMASQPDNSNFCNFETCFSPAGDLFINLGQGSSLGTAGLTGVTLERDGAFGFFNWIVKIACYTDAAYTQACPDWVSVTNGNSTGFIQEGTVASSTDSKYVTASFSNERNFDGSNPVTFKSAYYYQLEINDNGGSMGTYGSATLPYYVIMGLTQ